MAVSNAQKLAKAKYQHEKRALVASEVSKEKCDEYKAAAAELGISLASLVRIGVEEFIERHGGGSLPAASKEERLSTADKRLVEDFKALSPKSQKALRDIISELVATKGGDDDDGSGSF